MKSTIPIAIDRGGLIGSYTYLLSVREFEFRTNTLFELNFHFFFQLELVLFTVILPEACQAESDIAVCNLTNQV